MMVETRRYYCDACGKETTTEHYTATIDILELDYEGHAELKGYDFCENCMKSFVEWKRSRKQNATLA